MVRILALLSLWLILLLLSPIRYLWWLILVLGNTNRAWRMAVSEDQSWNVLFGGHEDETISSRAGKRVSKRKWACLLCKILDKIDPGHCAKNIEQ